MIKTFHAFTGGVALLIISTFWISTVIFEIFGSCHQVVQVKIAILNAMVVLIPAMIVAGGSGFYLGGSWKSDLIKRKRIRMRIIAVNGMVILLPCAVFLAFKAEAREFDMLFYGVQMIELLAGATNIGLLSGNMSDGIKLRSQRRLRELR